MEPRIDAAAVDNRELQAALLARKMRGIAGMFRRGDPQRDGTQWFKLGTAAGEIVIEAHKLNALPDVRALIDLVRHHLSPLKKEEMFRPDGTRRATVRIHHPANLFDTLKGGNLANVRLDAGGAIVFAEVDEQGQPIPRGGLMPIVPEPERSAATCEWLADAIELTAKQKTVEEESFTLADVARGLDWWTGRPRRPDSTRVKRLNLPDNGKTGKAKRISLAAVADYARKAGVTFSFELLRKRLS